MCTLEHTHEQGSSLICQHPGGGDDARRRKDEISVREKEREKNQPTDQTRVDNETNVMGSAPCSPFYFSFAAFSLLL